MYLTSYKILAYNKYLLKQWHIMEHILANKYIRTAVYTHNNTSIYIMHTHTYMNLLSYPHTYVYSFR